MCLTCVCSWALPVTVVAYEVPAHWTHSACPQLWPAHQRLQLALLAAPAFEALALHKCAQQVLLWICFTHNMSPLQSQFRMALHHSPLFLSDCSDKPHLLPALSNCLAAAAKPECRMHLSGSQVGLSLAKMSNCSILSGGGCVSTCDSAQVLHCEKQLPLSKYVIHLSSVTSHISCNMLDQ